MKNFKIIGIMITVCVAHLVHGGGPAGMVSDEISDMTAGSVGRNVSREAAGEVAGEAARVANKSGFAFHKPTTETPVQGHVMTPSQKAEYTQGPLPSQRQEFVSVSPNARRGIMKAYEQQRVQTTPAPRTGPTPSEVGKALMRRQQQTSPRS